MIIKVNILVLLLLQTFVSISQNNQQVLKKAEKYYQELFFRKDAYSKSHTANFMKKNGYPPHPELYDKKFDRLERDSLANLAYKKADCREESISYLEERLQIWELMKGGLLPDSTFTVLMDAFYDIAPEQAIDFSVEHWAFNKLLERQSFEVGEGYNLRNYPYVQFLFDNLDRPQLLHVVLTHEGSEIKTEQNQTQLLFNPQSLAELVIQSLRGRMSREDFDEIIPFVQAYVRIHDGADLNEKFIFQIEKIADGRKK